MQTDSSSFRSFVWISEGRRRRVVRTQLPFEHQELFETMLVFENYPSEGGLTQENTTQAECEAGGERGAAGERMELLMDAADGTGRHSTPVMDDLAWHAKKHLHISLYIHNIYVCNGLVCLRYMFVSSAAVACVSTCR